MRRRPLTTSGDQRLVVRARSFRVHIVREPEPRYGHDIATPRDVACLAHALIGDLAQEVVIAVWVDARHRAVGHTEICRGTLNASRFTPRDVLVPGLLVGAAGLALAHCHPSGDSTPSRADRLVTAKVRRACELIGMVMLDHVVVSDSEWWSIENETGGAFLAAGSRLAVDVPAAGTAH